MPRSATTIRRWPCTAAGRTPGRLVMEHADVQRAGVLAAVAAHGGWTEIADHDDLAGRPRYLTARRSRDASPVEPLG